MTSRLGRSLAGRAVIVCLATSLAAATLGAHSAAADVLSWAPGVTTPSPASSQPGVLITSISCASAGNCAAVGSYQDSSGETQGLLVTETGGRWAAGSTAKLPFNPDAANPDVEINSVSCASVGNCTAVGSYLDVHGLTQGLLLTETSGTWGQGKEVIHPQGVASVAANPQIDLASVSCATATNCVAVGSYTDSKGYPEGFLETEINGTWSETQKNGAWSYTGAEASLPGDAASEPKVILTSVSCGAVGRCVVVGSYWNSAVQQEGLLLTGTVSTGAWTFSPTAASLPSGASASPLVSLNSVSCTAAGECDAVGSYADSSHHQQGLLLAETGSAWQTGTKAVLPGDASTNPDVSLASVSCSSVGNCAAVGDYYTGVGNMQGLMLTATAGNWGAGAEPTIPADAGSAVFVSLSSVSCSATSNCAATGDYADEAFSSHPLLLSQSTGGAWSAGVEPALPYPNASPNANVEVVSCAPGGCTAVADYTDQADTELAGAVSGTLTPVANPALSLSAPPAVTESGTALAANDFSASLAGGTSESGSVAFRVFGPQDSPPISCAAGGTLIGAATVSGDGSYSLTQGFTPPAAGDYWWYASYGGDLGNASASSACGASMAETVVQTPALTLDVPAAIALGTVVSQSTVSASVSDAASNAEGTVTFTVFGPEAAPPTDCSAAGAAVGSASVQGNGSLNPSSDFTPGAVGDYWWYASYSGDLSDPAVASGCGPQMAETTVKATTTLALNGSASTATAGTAVSSPVSASLTGGVNEAGTVTFSVFGPQASPPTSCGSPTATVGSASVQNDGSYAPAASFTPPAAGDYWWYASYSGDSTNTSAGSGCGAQMAETVVSPAPVPPPTTTTNTATTTATTTTAPKPPPAATAPKPPPAAAARITKVTTTGNVLRVTITCRATSRQSCAGALKATTTEGVAAKATSKKKTSHAKAAPRVVTIATVAFTVRGGTSREVSIKLNRLGTGLLASRRKLSALVELHEDRTILSCTVTLRLPGLAKRRKA